MLLKSLKLKDFRQFVGEQEPIIFATEKDKNVTIVLGENGSGKTTLAQAFTWCLYGTTDFADSEVMSKSTALKMLPNDEEDVKVALTLVHNGIEYVITRVLTYRKGVNGSISKKGNAVLKIAFKNKDGQQEFKREIENDKTIKEILPKELSKYFFFDGERIGNMSKEIRKGKSKEFAEAVRSLLGLNSFTAALEHLDGRKSNTVIKNYDSNYDSKSNIKIEQYTSSIRDYENKIEVIDKRLEEIEYEKISVLDKAEKLAEKIKLNESSRELSINKESIVKKLTGLETRRTNDVKKIFEMFNYGGNDFFSKKLINDALVGLSTADKIDKGIPDIHARTIKFLVKRGECLCGSEICDGNDAYKHLQEVLAYIPPQSIGMQISEFVNTCKKNSKEQGNNFRNDIEERLKSIMEFEDIKAGYQEDISIIEQKLIGLENVGELQKSYKFYENKLKELEDEKSTKLVQKGRLETEKERQITERKNLTLNDENNKKIEVYKTYAKYMYDQLEKEYKDAEEKKRIELNEVVNQIFLKIYEGGFSLDINEKYEVEININNYEGYKNDIETSTAQSISIILSFIAGVIKLARDSQSNDNSLLTSEPYPLVMDAPLSAFDKERIKTICDVLPNVAEQVIIFIKDTDGDLAEQHLGSKVSARYDFDKKNELETFLVRRG